MRRLPISHEGGKMNRPIITASLLLLVTTVLGGCASQQKEGSPHMGQKGFAFDIEVLQKMAGRYLLYLPSGYGADDRQWPLLVFLHGAGERGDDLDLVKRHGPPKIVKDRDDFPFIVLSPQCAKESWWSPPLVKALIDTVVAQYRVDETRIYLTGFSMGAFGTWSVATDYPDLFAALLPICGGGDPTKAERIKQIPAWIFHGGKDPVVPLEKSTEMKKALEACGADVTLTVYQNLGHDSWTRTYENEEIYDWLLTQRKLGDVRQRL